MSIAIQTKSLTKRFKSTLAVDSINISVPTGVKCGFLGKNGAGKTTTIRMLTGLIKPCHGCITIMDSPRVYGTHADLSFGYLPDVPNFYGYMTGEEFLELCAKLLGIQAGYARIHILELLKKVGLDRTRTRISGYSRGMKQRLGIAQALLNNPPVVFMDEPISALDPVGRKDVSDIIRSLDSTTVFFSTHILTDVEHICDYVLIIDRGKILAQSTLHELKEERMANSSYVCFYDEADAKAFMQKAGEAGFETAQMGLRVTLKGAAQDSKSLSRTITALLHDTSIAAESFGQHRPNLEDIFHEVIANG